MSSFATTADMEQRTGGAIATATHPFLERELEAATRAIRAHCGWHIAGKEQQTMRRARPYHDQVWLPAMEIASIDEVISNGAVLDPATVEFDPDTGWTSLSARSMMVKFTAGFEEVPAEIVTLALQVAARALGSPLGIVREQAGGVSVTYSQAGFNIAGGNQLLAPEFAILTPYKLGVLP